MFGRKKEKLFGNEIEPRCAYCAHSTDSGDPCRISRKPDKTGACGEFSYDPLRRSPTSVPPLKKYDPEEFKL